MVEYTMPGVDVIRKKSVVESGDLLGELVSGVVHALMCGDGRRRLRRRASARRSARPAAMGSRPSGGTRASPTIAAPALRMKAFRSRRRTMNSPVWSTNRTASPTGWRFSVAWFDDGWLR
jgi:hypothetical protein